MLSEAIVGLVAPLMIFGATTIQSTICDPLAQPGITTPQSGDTVQAGSIFVEGAADKDTTVRIMVDGALVATTTATATDEFGSMVPIAKGSHTLTVSAANACDTKTSDTVLITADAPVIENPTPPPVKDTDSAKTPPLSVVGRNEQVQADRQPSDARKMIRNDFRLTLTSGNDGAAVTDSDIYISGFLSRKGIVEISKNGKVVARLDIAATQFGFTIPLDLGKNKFTIRATSGDTDIKKQITIIRNAENTPAESSIKQIDATHDSGMRASGLVLGAGIVVSMMTGWGLFLLAAKRRKDEDGEQGHL